MNSILFTASMATLTCGLLFQDPPKTNPHTQNPPATQGNDTTNRIPGQQAPAAMADNVFVTWLLVDNENEVALARLALQKAQSAEVKQFAQQMVEDHGKMIQKLNGLTTTSGRGTLGDSRTGDPRTGETQKNPTGRDTTSGRDATSGRDTTQPMEASGGRMMGSTGGIDHERLLRDLGKKCLESHTKMLQEKQGAEFDRCYMGMQVGAHVAAVDKIEVFRNHASPALRPALDEALPVIQQHLQHAKDLAKKTDEAKTGMGSDR